jgi:hypothetical protein
MRLPSWVAVVGLTGTVGCAEVVTDILEYSTVEVSTTRRSGEPVVGVPLIFFTGGRVMAFAETDVSGGHVFQFVAPNIYGVRAETPPGYARLDELLGGPVLDYVDNIEVGEGERESVGFTFFKIGPGRISVTVQEPDGTPIGQARVTLYSPQQAVDEMNTDPSGRVVFTPVPFGSWGVVVLPPAGFVAAGGSLFEDEILIEEGAEEEVTFTLATVP